MKRVASQPVQRAIGLGQVADWAAYAVALQLLAGVKVPAGQLVTTLKLDHTSMAPVWWFSAEGRKGASLGRQGHGKTTNE